MLETTSLPNLSEGSEVRIPEPGSSAGEYVSRWSNSQVELPAAVITPATEEDIISTIHFAAERGLQVIPANGGHGTFVPIRNNSIYLDLRKFNSIDLDEEAGTVTMGGGVITGEVVRVLSEKGWYTSVPNSNAVGMIGYCLGGGSSSFTALKGLAIDNVLRIRIITAEGKAMDLEPDSNGEAGNLFNVLCGAGFGFGVITSLTLRAWRISDLHMDGDKIWTRRLVFAPPAIEIAAELYAKLQYSADPRLLATLLFMRAPPSAPRPGAPMAVMIVSFLGPHAEAKEAAADTFDEKYTAATVVAATDSTPLATMNDAVEPLNRHGDYKEMYAAWLHSITPEGIALAFRRWLRFGEEVPDARATSYVVLAAKKTHGMLEHDVEEKKFFPRTLRERPIFMQVVPWWTMEAAETEARSWAADMLNIVNAPQHVPAMQMGGSSEERRISAWAANLSKGIDLTTVWSRTQREEIRRVKEIWDPKRVFWNPVTDGV